MFFNNNTRQLAAVETRTAETLAAISGLENELSEASLEAITSGNWTTVDSLQARLREKHRQLEVMHLAAEKAKNAARQVELDAKAKEAAARRRSLAQHLARLQRAAADYESAVAMMVRSWQTMTESASAAQAQTDRPIPELTDRSLFNLAEKELARQGRKPDHLGSRQWAPGSGSAALGGQSFHELEPLSKAIARIARWTTDRFAVTSPKPTGKPKAVVAEATTSLVATGGPKDRMEPTGPQPAPAPEEHATDRLDALPLVAVSQASLAADPNEANAFRNLERLKNPHPTGSDEAAGFQQALAEMQGKTRHVQNQGE